METRLREELDTFKGLWEHGYFEGDPLDPMGGSSYGFMGYMSVLHGTYVACIKPYINSETIVLEIGPGRGGWTKCFLGAKEIWCLDALSAEYNRFHEYLGYPGNVKYFQVNDFSCSMLPDDKFDYFFSYGCFCHISPLGVNEYLKNMYPKLKSGAHGFLMISDYDKLNKAIGDVQKLTIERAFEGLRFLPVRWTLNLLKSLKLVKPLGWGKRNKDEDMNPVSGRWYHLGINEACELLISHGYKVLDPDMEVNQRDPMVHFFKP